MENFSALENLEFHRSEVTVVKSNIIHPDSFGNGPFCRLKVSTSAPAAPGVYAWVVDSGIHYVGKANYLIDVVAGAKRGRPYNDYTYIPPSKVQQNSSPRVRINGLLNKAFNNQLSVSWWWLATDTSEKALKIEAELINKFSPRWNRAKPRLR